MATTSKPRAIAPAKAPPAPRRPARMAEMAKLMHAKVSPSSAKGK